MRASPPPSGLLEQLNRNSTPYHDPLARVDWDSFDTRQFWLPEPAVSLYGLPAYHALPRQRRRALSQYELISFISAGLWLEAIFMERVARSLHRCRGELAELAYRLHELREEAGHSLMFLEVLRRSGLAEPPVRFHGLSIANLLGRYAPFESLGFSVAVLISEEVPDRMNRFVRRHRAEICPAVYEMVRIHVIDEARHIAHARSVLDARLPHLRRWQAHLLRPLLNAALREFVRAFYFPSARVYELAGLTPGRHWAALARANPQRLAFVDDGTRPTLRLLREHGLDLTWRAR
jgi:hypothetical protein